ncbi:serine dehydratase beta chain, partial [Acinetobacter baumannii]
MNLLGEYPIKFDAATDILWHKQEVLPGHPNGMKFMLSRNDGSSFEKIYYSTGGGFIYSAEELANSDSEAGSDKKTLP